MRIKFCIEEKLLNVYAANYSFQNENLNCQKLVCQQAARPWVQKCLCWKKYVYNGTK